MVPLVRIELTTYPLPRDCATTTLQRPGGVWDLRAPTLNPKYGEGSAAITEGFSEGKPPFAAIWHGPNHPRKAGGSPARQPAPPQDRSRPRAPPGGLAGGAKSPGIAAGKAPG